MSKFFGSVFKIFMPHEINLPSTKYLSAKSIRIMLWSRMILKFYLILLGLYLIVNFASLMQDLFVK